MTAREQYKLACRIARIANFDLLMMRKAFVRRGLSPEKLIFPAWGIYSLTCEFFGWHDSARHVEFLTRKMERAA